MNAYIFAGLPKAIQQVAYVPYVRPDAQPLYEEINREISRIGSRSLAVEYLLLENQEIFGFREIEINTRIRNYKYALTRSNISQSDFRWKPNEIKILLENSGKSARQVSFILNRTIVAIQFKRQQIRRGRR